MAWIIASIPLWACGLIFIIGAWATALNPEPGTSVIKRVRPWVICNLIGAALFAIAARMVS